MARSTSCPSGTKEVREIIAPGASASPINPSSGVPTVTPARDSSRRPTARTRMAGACATRRRSGPCCCRTRRRWRSCSGSLAMLRMFSSGLASSTTRSASLPGFDRADVAVEAERARRVDRRRSQAPDAASCRQARTPHVPMRAQAFALAVRADRNRNAEVADPVRELRDREHILFLGRDHGPPARARVEKPPRHPARQDRIVPDVACAGTNNFRRSGRRKRRPGSACRPSAEPFQNCMHVVIGVGDRAANARSSCGRRRSSSCCA